VHLCTHKVAKVQEKFQYRRSFSCAVNKQTKDKDRMNLCQLKLTATEDKVTAGAHGPSIRKITRRSCTLLPSIFSS